MSFTVVHPEYRNPFFFPLKTPASPTLRTIPVQKSEEEEEEEEEEEIVEKQRPLVIRKTTSSEEKREEEKEEQPQKVESVRSDSVGGFEEVSRDDVVEATKEDAEEMVKEEPKKEEEVKTEPSSTTNGHSATVAPKAAAPTVPKVTLTKADSSSSSSIVDFIHAHPVLVKQLLAVGVIGGVVGVGFVLVRKYR
ncbi:hypothetical protein PRIPAC_72714 [Pristionchus pacificus]|uniref:Uncharacterized protein n=1 Tax=Pristionchus pacificus TaxID=54126 RepID=A0A2A6BZZ1_PRIPA|nr:hypothetical protein PRIPAC_72714 [Pristionchus pacificus]|eukprot:PDM71397.1 hypothetical protein PRIPAC_37804 [Pristionchus pacificus]